MNILEVCRILGHFVKFHESKDTKSTDGQAARSEPIKTTFEIRMACQVQRCKPRLPEKIAEKNKRDKLFNDLITLLNSKGLKLSDSEVSSGKNFTSTLSSI